jgi:tetratricopeptide (TPR) repeat protein
MQFRNFKHALLSLAIIGLLGTAAVGSAAERRSSKPEVMYPDATREEPKVKGSTKVQKDLQALITTYNCATSEPEKTCKGPKQKDDEQVKADLASARTQADELIANPASTDFDKAMAAQLASQAAYNMDDTPATIAYLKQAIQLNTLDNNSHYQLMHMLAGIQLQEDKLDEGIATLNQYLAETKSTKPDDLILKGQALYQQEKYAEAIPILKQAIESSPEPKDNWQQLLMAAYAEAGQTGEAIQAAEKLAAKSPADKKAQMNQAADYLPADTFDQAAAVLEKVRAGGLMTDEKDYRQLYTTYANMDGKEKEVIAVINDGLQKGVLKPDQQTYLALAQSYYYSDQIPPAIEAWQKAAPLSKDGETYLNLAKVLWQEDRIPEAKQAAKSALEKGIKKPEEAKKIIALP